ncbi:Protein kinase superfamily protein [Forsythia ovata]|uniref:Protein kinase superfamily protein n=1 Tax=Forsythia ovata TaxID=205694 RepID=A0ABD1WUX0_9LAMI
MADSSSVDVILEFLRRNKFSKAEAALRGELCNRPDLSGVLQKLIIEDKELGIKSSQEINGGKVVEEDLKITSFRNSREGLMGTTSPQSSGEVLKELIVKEIESGTGSKGPESNWKKKFSMEKQRTVNELVGINDKYFVFGKNLDDTAHDLYSWKYSPSNGPVRSYQNAGGNISEKNFLRSQDSGKSRLDSAEAFDSGKDNARSGKYVNISGEKRTSWPGSTSKTNEELKHEMNGKSELKEVDQRSTRSIDDLADNTWSRSDESSHPSLELRKDCSVKTVLYSSKGDVSSSYDSAVNTGDKKEGKRKTELSHIMATTKEQVDDIVGVPCFGKSQGGGPKDFGAFGFQLAFENQKEELPRLAPVRLKLEDKPFNVHWEEKFQHDGPDPKIMNVDNGYLIGSFLDVPIGQDVIPSGGRRPGGCSWLSVSQGIVEDTSDLVSGFATIGDGLGETVDYPNEYWDSDEYEDEDDVGYMRQPIEDEAWFLAHEIDYPSDNEKDTGHVSVPDPVERGQNKDNEDDRLFAEEDSYLSGERYFESKNVDSVVPSDKSIGPPVIEKYQRNDENDLIGQHVGQLMDEELSLMCTEPVWQGFVSQTNELIMLGDGMVLNECGRPRLDDNCMDDDQHGSVRSIGVGINSNAADIGSEVRESLVGGGCVGDVEYFHDNDVGIGGPRHSQLNLDKSYGEQSKKDKIKTSRNISDKCTSIDTSACTQAKNHLNRGFSFPPADGQLVQTISSKSLWSNKGNTVVRDQADDCTVANNDVLASWKRKSSDSLPTKCSRDENAGNAGGSSNHSPSSLSNYVYIERENGKKEGDGKITGIQEEDPGVLLDEEEAAAMQEQVNQIKAQEEEFETFILKIVHRKNRTGFEEDKNFQVLLNSVIAGRYHVTEYLGSAAFSKAIQAHDLHTGMDVCVKVIKNNKDFFDQSLDEIKLLKYVNKHDPADKYHILRLYDYFYYREHLLIVCELLKANLYEFQKFNRESGGEVYFTMPRLQSITVQCLEALQFLHSLGLIHCDLKPENILVKSYSRCEVKVIDLGSSCFETDHLCSYVQSRSYRAPEVILGLPYDKKIDIWSLGCILAELCTGLVLFQNDSPATLLARVIGIIGPIDQEMLAKGRDTYKYFTKNHMLYERNQDSNRLEYLISKKSSLRHRLPMGDQGFIDFVDHLLEINPKKRPSASEALKHPWLQYPYEPISS